MTFKIADKFEIAISKAHAMLENGFSSKAEQKRALDACSKAMELVKAEFSSACLDLYTYDERKSAEFDEVNELYYAQPNTATFAKYLKRAESALVRMDGDLMSYLVASGEQVVAMVQSIKAAEINAQAPKVSAREVSIKLSIMELMEKRGEQFNRCLMLDEMFGRMPVHANVHLVHGHKGSIFLRAFYYVAGTLTPLSVIIAAMEEATRREKEAS